MHRTQAVLLVFAALGCAPRVTRTTPNATTVTPPPAASATPPADAGGTTPSAEPPAAFAPTFDEEMACRRAHCFVGGAAHCLDTCYKYNHPKHPHRHETCNDSCRYNYDIPACENACARDRRAFARVPATVPPACRTAMSACRRDCGEHAPNSCDLHCLVALETCESESAR